MVSCTGQVFLFSASRAPSRLLEQESLGKLCLRDRNVLEIGSATGALAIFLHKRGLPLFVCSSLSEF